MDLVVQGDELDIDLEDVNKEDILTICYTSGTTGDPKGALLSHRSIISNLASPDFLGVKMTPNDVHYSYLPLAHVLERNITFFCIKSGMRIGYYQGDITKIKDDLATLQPSLFITVPRLLNRFYDLMMSGIRQQTGFKKNLIDWAISTKTTNFNSTGMTYYFYW